MAAQISDGMTAVKALEFCEKRKLILSEQHPQGVAFYYSPSGARYTFIKTDKGIVAWLG